MARFHSIASPPPIDPFPTLIYCLCKQYFGGYMRTFISGVAFYMLDEGERLTKAQVYSNQHTCGYVIWPRDGKWDVRKMGLRGWEKISDKLFDTENEALVFAYDKYCAEEEIKSRAWRR